MLPAAVSIAVREKLPPLNITLPMVYLQENRQIIGKKSDNIRNSQKNTPENRR